MIARTGSLVPLLVVYFRTGSKPSRRSQKGLTVVCAPSTDETHLTHLVSPFCFVFVAQCNGIADETIWPLQSDELRVVD